MRVLELFSGTHSIGIVCKELGYDVVSLDRDIGNSCKLNPEYISSHHIKEDILKWDYKKLKEGEFDIITASPVCSWWSLLRKCCYGRKLKAHTEPFSEKLRLEDINKYGKPMVDKVFEIIEYFKPKYWWIENPKISQMWKYTKEIRPQYTNYITLDYCMFSDYGYKKPTTFLSNIPNLKDVRCKNDCDNMKNRDYSKEHKINIEKVGGGNNRLQRYRIPPKLIHHLLSRCMEYNKI